MLGQKLVLSFSSKIIVKAIQFVGTIVVARIAGPTVLGIVSYGLAFVSIFGFIADLGTGTAHMKLVSDGNNNKADCNKTFIIIRSGLLVLFTVVIILYYYIQKTFLGFDFPSEQHKWVVIISLGILILVNVVNIPIGLFSARVEQAKQDIPNIIKTIVNQSLRIAVVLLGYGAIAISLTNLVALIIVIPIYFYLTKGVIFGKFDKVLAIKYFKISLPLIVVVAINSYLAFGDKLILQYYSNSEQVGIYVAGYRLADFVLLIAGSVGILFFPTFTKLISENNINRINDVINKFERFSFSFILPFVLSLFLFSEFIVHFILGSSYEQSSLILAVITLALFVFTVAMPYGNIITARNKFTIFAGVNILKGIVFTLFSYIFVSNIGLDLKGFGMSLAVLIAFIFYALSLIIVSKHLQPNIKTIESWRIIVFGVVYSFSFNFIIGFFSIDYQSIINLLLIALYFIGFWLFSFIFKIVKKNDFLIILDVVNISKIKSYINSEMKKNSK